MPRQMRIGITTARNCRGPDRPDDGRIELAAEAELHLVLVERAEHVEEVLRVEADGHVRAGVLDGDLVEALAALRRLAS